jgi:hypothetical protein
MCFLKNVQENTSIRFNESLEKENPPAKSAGGRYCYILLFNTKIIAL